MSSIDKRIVQMEFDNKNFESGVKTTLSSLKNLNEKLKMSNTSKGLEGISRAAGKVNLNGLSSGVEAVTAKFNALGVMGATALAKITSSAMSAGASLVKSLAIQPITDGFSEYETKMNSIQTILTNTAHQGTTLKDVTSTLNELNNYADKTIYNFAEMTRNIGTFTAAGVDLETSTAAIKGIANLAAASGSSSAQASTVMYQLSQALAAGKVSLQDWNSVVNGGMGGKLFQDALIRTSEVMGTGAEAAIKKYGSFRESLTKGEWLTGDVLTETLKQISGAYTEAELKAQGYTDAQAKAIVQLAENATKAATEVKTVSQLFDTMKESVGSGWAQSWEYIIGDKDQATKLLTSISDGFNNIIKPSTDARNAMLKFWNENGGRDDVIAFPAPPITLPIPLSPFVIPSEILPKKLLLFAASFNPEANLPIADVTDNTICPIPLNILVKGEKPLNSEVTAFLPKLKTEKSPLNVFLILLAVESLILNFSVRFLNPSEI